MRVLIVDDSVEMCDILQELLQRQGYDTKATSGERFRAEMAQHFDMLVTDIYMPGREGLEIISEIHRIDPALRIIAMSGGTDYPLMLRAAAQLGASKTLAKPFTGDEFVTAVNEAMSNPAPRASAP